MASLDSTERAKVALAAGESLIVTTSGQCTVQGLSGAPSSTTTLTANSQTFGPYGVAAVLLVTNVSGRTDYVADNATFPLSRAEKALFNTLVSGAGAALQSVHRLTVFGHSRGNFQASGGSLFTSPDLVGPTAAMYEAVKTPAWAAAYLGDAEYVACHAISGAALASGADAWSAVGRQYGKTVADLGGRGLDGIHWIYGCNDIRDNGAAYTSTAAADTLVAGLVAEYKKAILTGLSLVPKFVFETDYPCQSAGWISNPAMCQYALDSLNAQMVAWVTANFVTAKIGAVADSAALLKQADGFANASLYLPANNIHLNQAGARIAGAAVAAAWRTILARKVGAAIASSLLPVNYIPRGVAATNIGANDAGTGTATAGAWGVDATTGETYFETTWTPTTLAGGTARVRIMLQASLGLASSLYTIAGAETLAGAARVVLDDGSGGAPNANNVVLRHRLFGTAPFFQDWGGVGNTGIPDFDKAQDLRLWTPRFASTTDSAGLTDPAGDNTGYGIYLMVEAQRVGAPCRIRVYPSARRIG